MANHSRNINSCVSARSERDELAGCDARRKDSPFIQVSLAAGLSLVFPGWKLSGMAASGIWTTGTTERYPPRFKMSLATPVSSGQ